MSMEDVSELMYRDHMKSIERLSKMCTCCPFHGPHVVKESTEHKIDSSEKKLEDEVVSE